MIFETNSMVQAKCNVLFVWWVFECVCDERRKSTTTKYSLRTEGDYMYNLHYVHEIYISFIQ